MERLQFEKFPLGFWACYPYDITGMTEKEIADMADCGMTLIMSPGTSHEYVAETLQALDLCQKYGIKMILLDARTHWSHILQGEDAYRAAMRQAYEDFGKHPAVFGFFLGDEPHESQMQDCVRAHKIALAECPGLIPYLNQNPGYAEKCRTFVLESGCRILSYDRYNQMNPGTEGVEDFISDFIAYKALADEVNCPLLSIMLSVGHFRYRVPSEDDFRWQMGVALACGASAVFWFTYHTPERNNNYRGAPISEFGEKNPSWYALKNVQRRFNRDYADLLNHVTHRGVYWFGKGYGNMKPYDPAGSADAVGATITGIHSANNVPGIVSYWEGRDAYAGKKYIMITNNSWDASDCFYIHLDPSVKKIMRCYSDDEMDYEKYHWDAVFGRSESAVDVGVFLAPGQFEIFRFES